MVTEITTLRENLEAALESDEASLAEN